jgi:hypothetical protein
MTKLEVVPGRTTSINSLRAIASVLKVPVGSLIDPSFRRFMEECLSAMEDESESAGASR